MQNVEEDDIVEYYCPVKITNCFWLNSIYLMAVCSYLDLNKVYVLFVPTKKHGLVSAMQARLQIAERECFI